MIEKIKRNRYSFIGVILFALSFCFAIMFIYQNKYCCMSNFSNHVISYSSVRGIDVSKLVLFYVLFLFFVCLGIFFIVFGYKSNHKFKLFIELLFYKFGKKFHKLLARLMYNKNIILIVLCCVLLYINALCVVNHDNLVINILIISIVFSSLQKDLNLENLIARGVFLFSIIYSFWVVLYNFFLFNYDFLINKYLIYFLSFVIGYAYVRFYQRHYSKFFYFGWINILIIILQCLMIESFFWLKCHEADIRELFVVFFVLLFLSLLFVIFVIMHSEKEDPKLFYLWMIISWAFSCSLRNNNTINFYESSNHGISISEYIHYGKIPMIDNFDAHMFSNSFLGIIYYRIFDDYYDALKTPYTYLYLLLLIISVFGIIYYVVGKKAYIAFAFTALCPFSSIIAESIALPNDAVFMFGLFMILVFIYWKNKTNIIKHLILWGAAALSVLIQLDTGFAFGLSAIFISILYLLYHRRWKCLITFLIVGVLLTISIFLFIWMLIKNEPMDLFEWLNRFFNLILSNQNWAIVDLANSEKVKFYVLYPTIFYITVCVFVCQKRVNKTTRLVVLFILLSQLLNSSRTIVRHTLHEDREFVAGIINFGFYIMLITMSSVIIFSNKNLKISLFNNNTNCLYNKNKIEMLNCKIILTMLSIYLIVFVIHGDYSKDVLDCIHLNMCSVWDELYDNDDCNDDEFDEMIIELDTLLESTLNNQETFFDYSNCTNLFAYVNKSNPVYVNQSPGLVNGEAGQKDIINQLTNNKNIIPLVVMKTKYSVFVDDLDGVKKDDRYYLVSEYIYDNYMPLYLSDNYEIWCLKERWIDLNNKISDKNRFNCIKYSDDEHYLGEIPYLWANRDNNDNIISKKNNDINKGKYIIIDIFAGREVDNYSFKIKYSNESIETYVFNLKKVITNIKLELVMIMIIIFQK